MFTYAALSQVGRRHMRNLSHVQRGTVLGWVTKYEYPVLQELFFFPPTFTKAILRSAELLSLCNVVSSIYQLFVPHFDMAIFMCI